MMWRTVAAAGVFAIIQAGTPARAVTPQEKMETCKVGADHQKLAGGKRKAFLSRCMSNADAPARHAKPAPKPQ